MAIVKFTDTYATIAEIDPAMSTFCEWQNKGTLDKETLLKNASSMIDTFMKFAGSKVSEIQPMQFPRDFDTDEELFLQTEQERRLIIAVCYQLTFALDQIPIGKVSLMKEDQRKKRYSGLSVDCQNILSIYEYKESISSNGWWQ